MGVRCLIHDTIVKRLLPFLYLHNTVLELFYIGYETLVHSKFERLQPGDAKSRKQGQNQQTHSVQMISSAHCAFGPEKRTETGS